MLLIENIIVITVTKDLLLPLFMLFC